MSTNRHQNPKIACGRRLLSPHSPISSTNNQAEDESHRRSVDSALNYTEYRDPASVIKEDEEESSTDSNRSSNNSPEVEVDELGELLDSIVVGTGSRRNSLVDLVITNSDNLDITTPHFDENPSKRKLPSESFRRSQ